MTSGYFATPIYITYNREHGHYEAIRKGTDAPIGIGDDQNEAVEHLLRAERRAAEE